MKKRFQHLLMLGAMLVLGGLLAYRILSKPAPTPTATSSVQPRSAVQTTPAPAAPIAEPPPPTTASAPAVQVGKPVESPLAPSPAASKPPPIPTTPDLEALTTKVAQAEALRVSLVRQIGALQSTNDQLQQDLTRARAVGAEVESLRQKLGDAEKKISEHAADSAGDSAAAREHVAALDGVKRRTFIVNP